MKSSPSTTWLPQLGPSWPRKGRYAMELSRQTLTELRAVVHRLCGLAIPEEKAYLIEHRLEPIVVSRGWRSYEELLRHLRTTNDLVLQEQIIEAITTNETSFFRDVHPFAALRLHVLPQLVQTQQLRRRELRPSRRIRFWCAAVSTGQEAISVAIQIKEYLASNPGCGLKDADFSILATDISSRVLNLAIAGQYTERDLMRGLSATQIQRYFRKQDDRWVALDGLRNLIEYRRLNLAQGLPSLGSFDVIFCRNVLIYFDDDTRRRICRQFVDLLEPEGYLFLGSAENLYGVSDRFASLRLGESLVYRKLAAV